MGRLLLVEDNELSREMLRRRLTRRGFTVLEAEDGSQALRMALEDQPQIILMDLDLPGIDGIEVTRRLKRAPETRGIPIVALTAHAIVEDRDRALNAGCDGFETKPVDMDRLMLTIRRFLPED